MFIKKPSLFDLQQDKSTFLHTMSGSTLRIGAAVVMLSSPALSLNVFQNSPAHSVQDNPAVQHALNNLRSEPESIDVFPTGNQFQVNSFSPNKQFDPAVAMDAEGDFVVIWESNGALNDSSFYSIQGQRYDNNGVKQGPQFQVNTYTSFSQRAPAIAMDEDGDFIVVWQSIGSDFGDDSFNSIQGQLYNQNGIPRGPQFQINTYTTNQQRYPDVAMDENGNFVVVWQSNGSNNGDLNESIQGRRYNSNGIPQENQFLVNTYTTNNQLHPAIAMDNDGNFVVAWESDVSVGDDLTESIQAQLFNSDGSPLDNQFQVNTYTANKQSSAAVAMDTDGDFVILWESDGSDDADTSYESIQGQRFNSGGGAEGNQFEVNTYSTDSQSKPAVAMDANGNFTVVWESIGSNDEDYSLSSIQGQRFSNTGANLGSQFQINTYTTNYQRIPAVAMDADGDLVAIWASYGSDGGDNSLYSIQGQRYLRTDEQVNTYTTDDQRRPAVAMDSDGDFVIVWQSDVADDDTDSYSIQGQRFDSSGSALGPQFQVNTYTTGKQLLPDVAMDSDGNFVVVWSSFGGLTDSDSYSIQGQRFDSSGQAQDGQFLVNTYTTNAQQVPAVAMDSDGDFVVVWQSDGSDQYLGDTDDKSIQGQRFASNGDTQGGQFEINTITSGQQSLPDVAMDSEGNFVVIWRSSTILEATSGWTFEGQRFDNSGQAQGSQFQVNSYSVSLQPDLYPSSAVAMDSEGNFVVAWQSVGGYGSDTGYSIQGQRFRSDGEPQDSQFQINSYTTSIQFSPDVAMDSDGDFVVVWLSYGSESGDTSGVEGQRFNKFGQPLEKQFKVNSYTTSTQFHAAVGMDHDGDFVVSWQSKGSLDTDSDGYSIQMKRYAYKPLNYIYVPIIIK